MKTRRKPERRPASILEAAAYLRAESGRADLLRAIDAGVLPQMANLLGYEAPVDPPENAMPVRMATRTKISTCRLKLVPEPARPALLWRLEHYERFNPDDIERQLSEDRELLRANVRAKPVAEGVEANLEFRDVPSTPRLGDLAQLGGALRAAAARPHPVRSLDTGRLIRRLSRAEGVRRPPRLSRPRWGATARLVIDRADHLKPYDFDLDTIAEEIERLFPYGAVRHEHCRQPDDILPAGDNEFVMVLSDLGALSPARLSAMKAWTDVGRILRANGPKPVAIVPAAPPEPFGEVAEVWSVCGWDRWWLAPGAKEGELARLEAIAAPAVRVEPGLLRGLRLLLARHPAQAGAPPAAWTEVVFWMSRYFVRRHVSGAWPDPARRKAALLEFNNLDLHLRRDALNLINRWHDGWQWADAEELGGLGVESRHLADKARLSGAALWLDGFAADLSSAQGGGRGDASYGQRCLERFSPEALSLSPEMDQDEAAAVRVMQTAVARASQVIYGLPGHQPWPDEALRHYRPELALPTVLKQSQIDLRVGADLQLDADGEGRGSYLATIRFRRPELIVEPLPPFWKSGAPPSWAEAWGCDAIGPWVEFAVSARRGPAVVQRMRWIPAGRFTMGSPEDEAERLSSEGPRHEVTLSRGFWLFDTACTQALWSAVMGKNPSRFKGDARPVERVSWNDAQAFIARINALVGGLDLALPTEAQWEYACRAGTETSFSFGTNIGPALVNYNGRIPYADGAMGTSRGETVSVASLPANPFGLFEMHGNVWEWCEDGMRDYRRKDATDPVGSTEYGAKRVLRGGSWFDFARDCQSPSWDALDPDFRAYYTGFRCARVQAGAEPDGARRIRQAERRIAASRSGGAERGLMVPGGSAARRPLPPAAPFVIRTDCERLTFAAMPLPDWASAFGRDRHGLWARFEVAGADGAPVSQRMRWIPPGSFRMGSLEDERERLKREGPQRTVTFSQGFWLFDTACPQALWQAVMGENPSRFKDDTGRLPVEQVSWNDCDEFIKRINAQKPGLDLALPSEAQWEYACRAGTSTPFSFGPNVTPAQVNYDGSRPYADGEKGEDRNRTVPVASLPANHGGLYEMHGNVWEWCADVFHDSYADAPTDGSARLDGGNYARRVLRGGSWISEARHCRSAYRYADFPDYRVYSTGFRCARVQA